VAGGLVPGSALTGVKPKVGDHPHFLVCGTRAEGRHNGAATREAVGAAASVVAVVVSEDSEEAAPVAGRERELVNAT
jgi:hypothetical protein